MARMAGGISAIIRDIGGIRGPQVPLNAGNYTFVLGYPGPQPAFNLREQAYVVPYYSIID
jgi:hypothetical protein